MQETGDMDLLRKYVQGNSNEAFAALVTRYVNLVYSAALRKTNNASAAEEITQAVFIMLAKKADRLRAGTILAGWLYQTARLTSASFLRTEIRRARREQEAYMQSLSNEPEPELWPQIAPLLEDAMGGLRDNERNAIVLRFFEGKSFQEIGVAVGATENAAKKRVAHGLEKIRKFFAKRGVVCTATLIAGAVSANSVHAAPTLLTTSITAVAVSKGAAASASTLTLIKGALKIMAWTKAKTAIVVGVAMVLAAGTATPLIIHHHQRTNPSQDSPSSIFTSTQDVSAVDNAGYMKSTGETPAEVAKTLFEGYANEDWTAVGKYQPPDPSRNSPAGFVSDTMKRIYGSMQIIKLGTPFHGRISVAKLIEMQPEARDQLKGKTDFKYPGIFVPYEVRLKDGTTNIWQVAIRCDNPEHRWFFDGGM